MLSFDKTLKKTFRITPEMFEQSSSICKKVGLVFPEYVRYLIAQDIRRTAREIPSQISETEKKELSKILVDVKKGNIRSARDIESIIQRFVY